MPFEALFVPTPLREAVSDRAWLDAMLEAERALAVAEARVGVITAEAADEVVRACDPELYDVEELARDGRRAGNPVEPLVRALRARAEHAHHGATSQDIMDTAAALVAREGVRRVRAELAGVAAECARLADEHRATLMPARTLLQQAVPTTLGLKAAVWLLAIHHAAVDQQLPAQLGGAAGTLAALGDRGLAVLEEFARELELVAPYLPWHANRVAVAQLGNELAVAAGACAKVALDVQLLAQTEVAEVRVASAGGSTTMPHKRNPVAPTLARSCALHAHAAASTLTLAVAGEHERAAGAWHAEWKALSDALAYAGGAAAHVRQTLEGLEVDAERMRANLREETLSEAERFGGATRPEDYLGSASAFVDRALERYRG